MNTSKQATAVLATANRIDIKQAICFIKKKATALKNIFIKVVLSKFIKNFIIMLLLPFKYAGIALFAGLILWIVFMISDALFSGMASMSVNGLLVMIIFILILK